jgi:hypothetical protein
MQAVARGHSSDIEKAHALLLTAIEFEPGYYYYHHSYAEFILPKWNGEEGDSEKFAQESADRVGGAEGDILIFRWLHR